MFKLLLGKPEAHAVMMLNEIRYLSNYMYVSVYNGYVGCGLFYKDRSLIGF